MKSELLEHLRQSLWFHLRAISCISLTIGCAVAFFLWSLELVIQLFWANPKLLYGLPVAGALSAWMYAKYGKNCEAGNNLIYSEILHGLSTTALAKVYSKPDENVVGEALQIVPPHEPVPARMGLLVLIGSLITHICGGSAGREGTALQIGGAIASWFAQRFHLDNQQRAYVLQAGLAAGFGAVFGTPLAATVFAIEIVGLRFFTWRWLYLGLPCALVADQVATATGIKHSQFSLGIESVVALNLKSLSGVAVAGLVFGIATVLFLMLVKWVKSLHARANLPAMMQPVAGGVAMILLTWAIGTQQFLSLGVKANPTLPNNCSLESSFREGGAGPLSWLGKLTFTSITLGSNFKGGEATPLFFMGATLGNALSLPLGLPIPLLAAIGLVAMFAAATKTPLACTLMAVELFDLPITPSIHLAIFTLTACAIATTFRAAFYPDTRSDLFPRTHRQ